MTSNYVHALTELHYQCCNPVLLTHFFLRCC